MKSQKSAMLLSLALMFIMGICRGACAETAKKELLTDPAFTSDAGDWFFRDSSIVQESSSQKKVILNGVVPSNESWSHVGTEIDPVPLNSSLNFSCQVQGTKGRQKIIVNTFAYDSSNHLLKSWHKETLASTTEWTDLSSSCVAPANAKSLTLWVINGTANAAYVMKPSLTLGESANSVYAAPKKDSNSAEKAEEAKSGNNDADYDHRINGWIASTAKKKFEVGSDLNEHHSGSRCAYIKSIGAKTDKEFGNFMQAIVPNNYLDQRVKLSAWVKTKLNSGTAQLWMRVDGEWNSDATKPGTFDNMDDRPIKGDTDWKQYELVCDIPANANHVIFGLMLLGTGTAWIDDVTFTRVDKSTPLTGNYTTLTGCGKKEPINMNFEESSK